MATQKRTLSLYKSISETSHLSLHNSHLRRLFKLPKIKGQLVSAELIGQSVRIVFETARDKFIAHNI